MYPLKRIGNFTLFWDDEHDIYMIYNWETYDKKYYYSLEEAEAAFQCGINTQKTEQKK